ncbi:MAG: FliI/YscN family ATPase [Rhodobacteraceae bacterium]|nr:FliI/YscN family ATPase [Paracoccaceae bacterium]
MAMPDLNALRAEIDTCSVMRRLFRVLRASGGVVTLSLGEAGCRIGDRVRFVDLPGSGGEVIALEPGIATVLPDREVDGLQIGSRAEILGPVEIAPDPCWVGRIIDPFGRPVDGRPLMRGAVDYPVRADPPAPATRGRLGARLQTGLRVFNTLLPIVRGQRIGLFAGSGVGKSSLLGQLARGVEADLSVIALVGERGRELRDFVEDVLGPDGMARSIIIVATSDQSALIRRRAMWTAMTVAEYFRDKGMQVLFLADSITRFAEAHREVALAAGEPPSLRGFPPSTAHLLTALTERAGPGKAEGGDITAILSVLVAGSNMDEVIADTMRGVLDGHVVLDREIAERGRFPAINLLRSVSRALPAAATGPENLLIQRVRHVLGAYDRAEMMIQAGLYAAGSDPLVDLSIRLWPALDAFIAEKETDTVDGSFARLAEIFDAVDQKRKEMV